MLLQAPAELADRKELEHCFADNTQHVSASSRSPLLEAVRDVWKVTSEEDARSELLSYAATATLQPLERLQALAIQDPVERLEYARDALADQQRFLATVLETSRG